jgi:glutathione S-transferase
MPLQLFTLSNILSTMTSHLDIGTSEITMASKSNTANPNGEIHYTFYTSPSFFYPRRLHAYLTLKPLPPSIKSTLIPVTFDSKGQMTRPEGKIEGSIPMMRYGPSDEDFIRQSVAILNYLEERHPRGGWDMRGAPGLERARVEEVVSVVEEASQAFGFLVMHSSALYTALVPQSREAAKTAEGRVHRSLSILESYARHSVLERGEWIAGTERLTIADLCLGSLMEYARDMYAWDLKDGHEVLAKWMERWEGTEAGKKGGDKIPAREMTEVAMKRVWE